MSPRQLGAEVEVAHQGRDHDTHRRMLARLVALAEPAPLDVTALDAQQLESRRNLLHVQLAAVNEQLQRIGRTRNGMLQAGKLAADPDAGSLEPST